MLCVQEAQRFKYVWNIYCWTGKRWVQEGLMRNSKLMRKRANVSMLDLGRIKSDQEATGKYCVCIISTFSLLSWRMTYLYSQDWNCLSTYYSSSCMYFVQCCAHWCMFNYFFKVSHWNVGCSHLYVGLLPTHKGSVSMQEFVNRTDRVPHMSALLLFNITTEHTLNSRHGAVPFDM